MSMAIANNTVTGEFSRGTKASLTRRLLRYVMGECQRIAADREQLWHAHDASSYARSTPRCVWRRHGALLMYAKHRTHAHYSRTH